MMRELYDKLVKESTIDFPQKSLDPAIWNESEGTYSLKPEVKDQLYSILKLYKGVDLINIADAIHITGSTGTNLYKVDTDIDIHIIPKEGLEDTVVGEDMNVFQKEVFKWYKMNRDKFDAYISEHPVEVYIQFNKEQELLSDAVYNIMTDEWVKGPTIQPATYDPYEEFAHILDDVKAEAKNADLLFGELKRDVIDYETIKGAVSGMSKEEKKNLLTRLQNKLEEIESDIDKLMSVKQGWVDMRKSSSSPTTPEQALSDVELAKKWKDKNALFKFLDRYNYMHLIKDLETMVEDDNISPEEVGIIQGLLGSY